MSDAKLTQYYVAERGVLSDGALALLAARAALLGHARWRTSGSYRHWHDTVMTKVVLGGEPADVRAARSCSEALAVDLDGQVANLGTPAVLVVLPPRPKDAYVQVLGHLRLAPRGRGPAPEPTRQPAMVLVVADDVGMHGGKLAAQCAHAALLAQAAHAGHPAWATWVAAGRPLALRRLPSAALSTLAERYPGGAVHDAGHTQVAAGTLTVVAVPPFSGEAGLLLETGERW